MALNKGTLISRVRRMKDEIEAASESESNQAAADGKEPLGNEEVDENASRRGLKQMRHHATEAPGQHQYQHQHQHQHHHPHLHEQQQQIHSHRQHAPTCLASKLVSSNEPMSRTVKQHQPHCVHHKSTCPKEQLVRASHLNEDSPSEIAMPVESRGKPIKYLKQQDKSYLLVEYRPSSSDANNRLLHQQHDVRAIARRRQAVHLHQDAGEQSGAGDGSTTIKFISQLYFLLHLSVILSLLLHHKNLVISERKSQIWPQASSDAELGLPGGGQHVNKHTVNGSSLYLLANQQHNAATTTSSVFNQLPVPLMLQTNNWPANRPDGRLISSVVAAPTRTDRSVGQSEQRLNRRQVQLQAAQAGVQPPAADILVRLLGYWHAKCALQYLLCYLLSSSVTILVCLRLFRMCRRGNGAGNCGAKSDNEDPTSYGFYYRTRLDCTPVLVGSISLGLIQLIVIGLEIATNVDWLGDSRWPLYLPLLQFAFVSLLMQFILGKVAKKHKRSRAKISADEERSVLSIKNGKRLGNNGASGSQSSVDSPASNGLQNIALAHLLVTHILLWLMKLNSISLFQPIDQPQRQLQFQLEQQVAPIEHLLGANFTEAAQPKAPVAAHKEPTGRTEEFREAEESDDGSAAAERRRRLELEAILRKKSQLATAKLSPSQSASSPIAATSGSGTVRPVTADNTDTAAAKLEPTQQVSATNASASVSLADEPAPAGPKSERGLRSLLAANQSSAPERANSEPNQPISLADQGETGQVVRTALAANKTVKPDSVATRNHLAANSNSVGQFRSSLPKRMTAFRQNLNNGKQVGAPKAELGLADPSDGRQPRQRARVLVSREETAKTSGAPERPFPSVESDPPPSRSAPRNGQREASASSPTATSRSPIGPAVTEVPPGAEKPPDEQKSPEPKVGALDEEEEEEEPDSDGAELDLLLPPVPSYNETANEEEPEVPVPIAPQVPRNETREPSRPKSSESALLREEAFVFNEAASAANATLAPPPLLVASVQVSRQSTVANGSSAPLAEPLVMASKREQERDPRPSLADYLLPIVHQYHILIIAILFNMWLDSLAKRRSSFKSDCGLRTTGRLGMLGRDQPVVSSDSSSSELGSIARSSSTRGLIAIPIRGNGAKQRRRSEQLAEPKCLATGAGYAVERLHRNKERWTRNGLERRHHHRSRSMDYLRQQQALADNGAELNSNSTGLSRYNSLRSSSSERLLWISSSQLKSASSSRSAQLANLASYSLQSNADSTLTGSDGPLARPKHGRRQAPLATWSASEHLAPVQAVGRRLGRPNSVCGIFFGLLVVSGSLIVILLGVELLSALVQCLAQLVSILVCLLGLCLTWRHRTRSRNSDKLVLGRERLGAQTPRRRHRQRTVGQAAQAAGHRQCFHYLFLLAAYYCGIAIALNLNRQHSLQQLFSQQVLQFIQRHLGQTPGQLLVMRPSTPSSSAANYALLFHALLAAKGLLLILQVTLQTVLIRSSCQRATRELRQVYTFLMFANLSLWAMEICEQQKQLQTRDSEQLFANPADGFRLLTLDSFGRFAASIVTLSHLYHGLVFMQH